METSEEAAARGVPRGGDGGAEEARALRPVAVLAHLAGAGHPLTLSQLSVRLHIPKATLLRLMESLEAGGFIVHAPNERGYMPGPALANLALATLGNNSFTRSCRAVLRTLVAALGETCNITALDGDRVLYVERVETDEPLRQQLQPGAHVPLHCTASGKLFLAQMSALERKQLLARLPLPRMTPRTLTDAGLLAAELDRMSVRNIGVDNEEFVRGMVAVALPIRAADGHAIAALACHAPTARLSLSDLMQSVPKMEETARRLAPLLQQPAQP
ncbi:IclR family transcriptional regulator [Pandoraea sp.]|uniref:IclR family transcriptional regulator n=1 Tax=Pandoraea sp. TaxID=1883445 RepID=UPI0011FC59D6|nr:IclR family transcriptional regulator [Pandoraea sp.]MDE2288180.1 IclR family transcriptional regulator [Burkholderiales bacterium]MDE2611386.1 IclR family transcriptional regulator [Burkholderiales bacterium]TAL56207.1 MAG: IclR family transcriptional regulator [Pandoraea sp.]TAM19161.1 MAG: IclR family transcriptional regulator [Pandoraea sp.]